jgi:hypothetical protein
MWADAQFPIRDVDDDDDYEDDNLACGNSSAFICRMFLIILPYVRSIQIFVK